MSEPITLQNTSTEAHQIEASSGPSIRFGDAVESFYLYCRTEKQYAAESQIKIKDCFDAWLLRHFGNLLLTEIRPFHILRLRQAMAERKLSIARQYSLLMALKMFLKFCRAVLECPCLDPALIRLPKRSAPKVAYLTNLEIQAMRSCTGTHHLMGLRLRALFEALLATGMRISEALSLNRDSINPSTHQAIVIGKGSKQRTVFFSAEAVTWIERYLRMRQDNHEALFVTYGEAPNRWTRGDIPRYLKALGRTAGIQKHVTPHILRHTFCTNLRNHGADISLIKDLAGHQDIHTTARYYLGSDTAILREAVTRYLDFSPDAPQSSP
jgi:integrase/recombinase XerD